jgi:hypothetical protein
VAPFEFDIERNLLQLQAELYDQTLITWPTAARSAVSSTMIAWPGWRIGGGGL